MQISLFILVLVGCASAYYFPDGPPNRRHPTKYIPGVDPPEPKRIQLQLHGQPSKIIELPSNRSAVIEKATLKSIPDFSEGVNLIPRTLEPFSSKQSGCRNNYAFTQPGESVTVQSPNYPNEYPNNQNTNICFTSPEGTTMTVECNEFNVERDRRCSYDYVGIGEDTSTFQRYCGKGQLRAPPSSSNRLAFIFKSDSSNPGGNRDVYRFSCSVTVSGEDSGNPPPEGGDYNCGQRNNRIVGGTQASRNEFPWRCYMKTRRYSFFCGCSVISNRWIMTAAHCTDAVMPLEQGDVLYVVVGDHNRASSIGQQIAVESVHDHESYNSQTYDNDISLLRLANTITFTNTISPVCLPFNYANDNFQGTTVTASGWGTTRENGQVSDVLMEVDLPVLTTQECRRYLSGQITENMICTYQPGKDTCQGDSGGSIDLKRNGHHYAIGIVSWGIGCARENRPGVYALTTRYLNWIRTTSGGENFCQV